MVSVSIPETLQALAVRMSLLALGATSYFRTRMEVVSSPKGLDHVADAAFLHAAGTHVATPASGLFVNFVGVTGASALPAVALAALADVMSASSLFHLSLHSGLSLSQASTAAHLFLWNPLTLAVCISGSLESLRLAFLFIATACAAAGRSLPAGVAFALALHLSSPQTIVLAVPIVILALQRQEKVETKWKLLRGGVVVGFIVALGAASAVLSFLSSVLLGVSVQDSLRKLPLQGVEWWCSLVGVSCNSSYFSSSRYFSSGGGGGLQLSDVDDVQFSSGGSTSPNLGLQWYIFAEIFPIFR